MDAGGERVIEALALVAGLSVALGTLAVADLAGQASRRRRVRWIERLAPGMGGPDAKALDRAARLDVWIEGWLGRLGAIEAASRVAAGVRAGCAVRWLVGCALGAGLLVGLALRSGLAAGLGAAAGAAAASAWLARRAAVRREAVLRALPNAIDTVARGLRAGQSMDAALAEAARRTPAPVGEELERCVRSIDLGIPFEAAIRRLVAVDERLPELRLVTSALSMQRETGGRLVPLLDAVAHTLRERVTFARRVRALAAEARATGRVVGALPLVFAGATWLARPDYIRVLFEEPLGQACLGLAVAFELVGLFLLRRLARVEA
jgi:tight adherence protein B